MTPEQINKRSLRTSFKAKLFLLAAMTVIVMLLFPRGKSLELEATVGTLWTGDDVVAQFFFPLYKDAAEIKAEETEALKKILPLCDVRTEAGQRSLDSVSQIFRRVAEIVLAGRNHHITQDSTNREALSAVVNLSSEELSSLLKANPSRLKEWDRTLHEVLKRCYATGIIDAQTTETLRERRSTTIALRQSRTTEEVVSAEKFLDERKALVKIQEDIESAYGKDASVSSALVKIATRFLTPTIFLNKKATVEAEASALASITHTMGIVRKGDILIQKNQRVSSETKRALDSYRRAKVELGSPTSIALQYVGKTAHVGLILLMFGFYLYLIRKKIYNDNLSLLIIAIAIIIPSILAYVATQINTTLPLLYGVMVASSSMLLAIIFDSRTSFYATVTISLLIAGVMGNDYITALSSLGAGTLAAYTVRDIRSQAQLFRSIAYIFTGYAITIFAIGLERYEAPSHIYLALGIAAANASLSPLLTLGLLIVIEKSFGITSDLRLEEFDNINHPLLKELSEKAPGTFQHSMVLASMAERAAQAVEANPLLAKVGAMYHDIGKIAKPEFFVENQRGGRSRHERMSPVMSARLIIAHVRDGVELGKKYKIPEKILDFIPMHHGTTMVAYFYDRSMRRRSKQETIIPSDFQYPGPKPQSKETAIVMLADSSEASVRSLIEPTRENIEMTIDRAIKNRFLDGQLDECELTLAGLTKIREEFVTILTGIHHQRLVYPSTIPPLVIPTAIEEEEHVAPLETPEVPPSGNEEMASPEERLL